MDDATDCQTKAADDPARRFVDGMKESMRREIGEALVRVGLALQGIEPPDNIN